MSRTESNVEHVLLHFFICHKRFAFFFILVNFGTFKKSNYLEVCSSKNSKNYLVRFRDKRISGSLNHWDYSKKWVRERKRDEVNAVLVFWMHHTWIIKIKLMNMKKIQNVKQRMNELSQNYFLLMDIHLLFLLNFACRGSKFCHFLKFINQLNNKLRIFEF